MMPLHFAAQIRDTGKSDRVQKTKQKNNKKQNKKHTKTRRKRWGMTLLRLEKPFFLKFRLRQP